MKKSIISISLTLALLGGCASSPSVSEADIFQQYPSVQEASTLLTNAKDDNLAFYSPEQMKEARRVYDQAMKDAKAGKSGAGQLADEAVARAKAAKTQADKAKYTFEEVLLAREKALDVNATTVAPEDFQEAEKEFAKAIALLEIGQDAKAKKDIEAIKNQYLAIELKALKKNMLSFAQQAVAASEKNDLDDIAPRTIAQAKDELKLAINTLEANRTDTAKANIHSNRAIWLVKQAEGIADINAYFKNANFDEEQKILWYQEQLSTVIAPVNSDVQFNQMNKEVVAGLRQQLSALVNNNESLTASLSNAQTQVKQITSDSQSRESQLEQEKANALMQAQMERAAEQAAKKADDARFAAVQSMFTEEEATVYRQRDNVLIRAQGFAFKPGASEIESSNFVMLNKITDAIKRFPNATIVVSGHTDVTGSSELNLALSKARAEVVANFITQVSEIDKDRVSSTGYGKEKPVASNETPEGRAQNRRVEILIVNK
ncbi:OmpA family protein [Brumicola nitratireducens]|uniref:Outer membrane protein and related peptidoglycan-associated (Lipo)protein n=1 Tax=Glaciecola nitratireducens (strain JCM 12485 / KCTC 12276 / FR1064) TaxID=1085623 RepID=G4QFR6_GLANF|nr:OmpA family protein [Glaciecola nitratireducens]AEP28851.1 outer membrane protein and related peptidoglycan-associated (lipo)protein [Glaciecola nitratireducens FR1064]